jgi:hypothetical protein
MHTIFRAIVIALLLALIIGCSSVDKQPASVDDGDKSTILEKHDGNDLTRFLTYDQHAEEINPDAFSTLSEEGLGNDESKLVDCIGASYWEYTDSSNPPVTHRNNYILVCDTKYKWGTDWSFHPRCDIIRTNVAMHLYPFDHTSNENIGATTIRDPDGCELVVINNELHAWVWDDDDNIIYHYQWSISASSGTEGVLGTPQLIDYITGVSSAKGLAVVFGSSSTDYHLIVSEKVENQVVYYAHDDNGYSDPELIKDFGNDFPLDVCVTKYDDDVHLWNVYIAVRHDTDYSADYIQCVHWDGEDYGYGGFVADEYNGSNDKFPGIISLATRRYDDHDSGSVCVLMLDMVDFIGYRLRQINFRSQVVNGVVSYYYQFDEEFDDSSFQNADDPNAKLYLAQGFAMGKLYEERSQDNDYGNWYFISDRDYECLKELDFNNYDGKNLKAWRNYLSVQADNKQ